jgi:hypothetical protein
MTSDQDLLREPVQESTVDLSPELGDDPFDDDLDAELRARAPWRPGKVTVVLAGAVLMVAGFVGGVLVQKSVNPVPGNSSTGTAAGPGGFARNGQGANGGQINTGQGASAQASGQSNATTGTVKLVDGTTIYLTTADGEIVTVKTTGTTSVRTEQTAAVKDISVGAIVSVVGTTGANGIVTATQVTSQK